jgi:hypothetical protein
MQLDKEPSLQALYKVLHTSSTLKHLSITLDSPGILEDSDVFDENWGFFVNFLKEYPQSQKLQYTKLELDEVSLKGAEKCLDMTTLGSLSLSDCEHLQGLFTHMLKIDATCFNLRKLRLVLRRESDDGYSQGSTVEAVHKFVLHISGLEELCLLTELSIERNLVVEMLQQHQTTLKTLVFDFFNYPGGFVPFELGQPEMREMEFPLLKDLGVRIATYGPTFEPVSILLLPPQKFFHPTSPYRPTPGSPHSPPKPSSAPSTFEAYNNVRAPSRRATPPCAKSQTR